MSYKLHVRLIEARGLPKMDTISKTDPYCLLYSTQSPKKQRSRTRSNTHTPVWNENFHFDVFNPAQDQLFIDLFDEDVFFDDPFARFSLSMSTLQLGKIVDMWYDLLPVKRIKKAGKIHLLLHLALATDTPFIMSVNAPPPMMPAPQYIPPPQQPYPAYPQAAPMPAYIVQQPQPVYVHPQPIMPQPQPQPMMYAQPAPQMMYSPQPMMPQQQPMMYARPPQAQVLYPQPSTVPPPPPATAYAPAYQAQLQPQMLQSPGQPIYVQTNLNESDAKRMMLNQARGGY